MIRRLGVTSALLMIVHERTLSPNENALMNTRGLTAGQHVFGRTLRLGLPRPISQKGPLHAAFAFTSLEYIRSSVSARDRWSSRSIRFQYARTAAGPGGRDQCLRANVPVSRSTQA